MHKRLYLYLGPERIYLWAKAFPPWDQASENAHLLQLSKLPLLTLPTGSLLLMIARFPYLGAISVSYLIFLYPIIC